MNRLRILRAGLCSTVQDLGRPSFRDLGVPVGGAMDHVSHELANRLVGNPANAATIENTLTGDEIEFAKDSLIAITGAAMTPVLHCTGADPQPVAQNRPVSIPAGSRLCLQSARRGCRSYLAIAGGINVPVVLESRSTVLHASFGGHQGRMLAAGDDLPIGVLSSSNTEVLAYLSTLGQFVHPRWFVRTMDLPNSDVATLRIISATHTAQLMQSARTLLSESEFRISSQSDRMGYRLVDQPLELEQRQELHSEGAVPGTIQLPRDGNPILLMADCAPTGGYPRIGHVISADLSLAAQLRPGQLVRFQMVTLEQAQHCCRHQQQCLTKALAMVELISR